MMKATWMLPILLISGQSIAQTPPPQTSSSLFTLDKLTIAAGYSKAYNSKNQRYGTVDGSYRYDNSGAAYNLNILSAKKLADLYQPYLDYALLEHSDRNIHLFTTGIRHDFTFEQKELLLHLSGGIGLAYADWKESPIAGFDIESKSATSLSGSFAAGMSYVFSEHMGVDLSVRYDVYDLNLNVNDYAGKDTIKDFGSLSVMLGFVIQFEQ
ncbi:outer membrane beta-barrel protein [uncultured Shewanella sp.]|uniref:outer membrane beta-barrel protein n=1 Tax=uncultured Shewanella sp. TaxID=173975 RepID=UPI0026020513|nr:outer membrane beta-barrel protein [uncultured Shewanella sp.]